MDPLTKEGAASADSDSLRSGKVAWRENGERPEAFGRLRFPGTYSISNGGQGSHN